MNLTPYKRIFRNAFSHLRRNVLLSLATILIIALMMFVFNVILALNTAAHSVIEQVGEKLDISVEILPEVENYSIQAFIENLKQQPEIKEVVFISKEEALKRFGTKYPNIIGFIESHQLQNPLPNTVRIVSRNIADNNTIISKLESAQWSALINQQKLQENLVQKSRNEKILSISRFVQTTGIGLNLIFALIAMLIMLNSINLNIHHQRHEVRVMKLVGAKISFIRGTFMAEGMMIALLAALLSIGFSKAILGTLAQNLIQILSSEQLLAGMNAILLQFNDRFFLTAFLQILAALAFGALSSFLAIELYLRKKEGF